MKLGIKRVFRRKDVWVRIGITFFFLLIFRLGALITIPGVNIIGSSGLQEGSFFELLNILGGGALGSVSLFALGVSPYITASIIIQLLASDVIPPLARMKKEGQKGQQKIEKITRLTAIIIAIIQGLSITLALQQSGYIQLEAWSSGWAGLMMITFILVAGSLTTLWLADQITIKGVGNGTSLIIFTGIISGLPFQIMNAFDYLIPGNTPESIFIGVMNFIGYLSILLIIILLVVFFTQSERRMPIQQTGKGLSVGSQKVNFLPFKVNPAGVIPVIFATSVITIPPTIAQLIPGQNEAKIWVQDWFSLYHWFGLTLYALLIMAFTYFYAHISLDPDQISENFKKQGTFILGVKPGDETTKYLKKTINNLCFYGGFFLVIISVVPYVVGMFLPSSIVLGGTSTIIMVSVALETISELKQRFKTKNLSDKIKSEFEKASLKKDENSTTQKETTTLLW